MFKTFVDCIWISDETSLFDDQDKLGELVRSVDKSVNDWVEQSVPCVSKMRAQLSQNTSGGGTRIIYCVTLYME